MTSETTTVADRRDAIAELDRLLAGDPAAVRDPNPVYHALRAAAPVVYSETLRMWFVTRYEDVAAGLRDRRMSAARMPKLLGTVEASPEERELMIERALRQMINSDPPDHTRRRGLVAAAFHPRRVEAYRERVRETADALLDALVERDGFDVVTDYAFPLPMSVLADLVGIPIEDASQVKAWADDIAAFLSKANVDADQVAAYLRSWEEMAAYFRLRLAEPDGLEEHVVNQLALRIREGGTDEEEALANLVLLAVAGHETTTGTIGLGLLRLLGEPQQLARLRADPSRIPSAVEELLRMEPIAQWDFRLALEDVEIGGETIRAGQLVNFVLAAANRDPAVFPDPDRLDVDRSPNRHLTFGIGAHHCLGSQLARLELAVAFDRLLARVPALELAADPEYKPNVRTRGLVHLEVRAPQGVEPNAPSPIAT